MWKEVVFTLGSTLGLWSLYKYYKYRYYKYQVDYVRFIASRDLPLKNVLDNEPIILELGVSAGSILRIRDLNEDIVISIKNIKSVVKLKSVLKDINPLDKTDKIIEYTFEDDSKLTFRKNPDTKHILCYYESDNQIICHEYVNDFINNYKTMCFNTEFDLLSELKN